MAYKFTTEYRIRGNTVAGQKSYMRFAVYTHSPMGVYLAYVGVGSYVEMAGTGATWKTFESPEYVVPANTGFIRVVFQMGTGGHSGEFEIKNPLMRRMADSSLIVGGAVTADKLEASLVLASKIVAGDPTGTRAEMTPGGFKVFSGSSPTEVVRLGVAATDDYFAITKADGTIAAAIDQTGRSSFTQVNTNELYYKGVELGKTLDDRGKGLVGAAIRYTNSTVNATVGGAFLPYLRLDVTLEPYRLYKVWTSAIKVDVDTGVGTTMALGYQTGIVATVNNWALFTQSMNPPAASSGGSQHMLAELFAFPGTAPVMHSFLLGFGIQQATSNGQAGVRADSWTPVRLVVEDLGPTSPSTGNGVHLNGTVTPPPAVQTYVKQYGCNNSMNYTGSNTQYNWDLGHMYQGLSPAGQGNTKSIGLFPSMTGDLSGATINYMRAYFTFDHWYYNSGGTARIGVHGHTGIPATFSSGGVIIDSGGWPKPGSRWVDIPSAHWNGFKTGQWRGLTLEGDGGYGTYGYAQRPTIEISYNK
jgi:hypothetical protein